MNRVTTVQMTLATLVRPVAIRSMLRLVLAIIGPGVSAFGQTPEAVNFFEKRIRPVLAKHCHTCHNPELRTAGLDLTTAEGFKQGGQSGSLVSVGEPQESRLLRVVNHQESVRMPPTGKLLDQEIVDFRTWVQLGAPWPDASETKVAQKAKLSEHQENLWAFQPIREPIVPEVTGHRWIRTPYRPLCTS